MLVVLALLSFGIPSLSKPTLEPRKHEVRLLLADADTYDIIKTKDGKVHTGHILRETQNGYLFKDVGGATGVILFTDIDSIHSTAPSKPAAGPASAVAAPALTSASASAVAKKRKVLKDDIDALNSDLGNWTYLYPIMYGVLGAVQLVIALVVPMSEYNFDLLVGDGLIFLLGGGVIYGAIVAVIRSNINEKLDARKQELKELEEHGRIDDRMPPMTVLARW